MRSPYFHIGFTVPDLDPAMNEFGTMLGIEWRAIIDLPRRGGGVLPPRGPPVRPRADAGDPPAAPGLIHPRPGRPPPPWYAGRSPAQRAGARALACRRSGTPPSHLPSPAPPGDRRAARARAGARG